MNQKRGIAITKELEDRVKKLTDELDLVKKKLELSEEFFEDHVENLNDVLFTVDNDGIFTYLNLAIEDITGYKRNDVLGTPFVQYVHPEDLPGLLKDMQLTVSGVHNPYMFRIIKKNGNISYVHTTSRPIIKNGHVTGINGLMVDIAKLKKIEFKLKEERDKAQRYLDIVGVIILALDKKGNISLINKKGCEVLGYMEEEILFRNWFDIAISERFTELARRDHSRLMDGQIDVVEYFETPIKTKNGEERTFAWHNIILKDESGNINGTLSSGEDITERKKANEALVTAKLISDNAQRTKREFISNISHELRTPLNLIIGYSDLLHIEAAGSMNDKQKGFASVIKKSGERLLVLINSMIELSDLEEDKIEVRKEDVSLPILVKEIQTSTAPMASKKTIDLQFYLEADNKVIYTDPNKFRTILYNLINNAIKFTHEKGKVRVTINEKDKDNLEISVMDTGIGISPDDQSKLFQPFSQIDSSLDRKFEGTGLGLSIVKEFLKMQNGSIWVESEPGQGSTFKFILPVGKDI
ncbi:PAS domain-containing sensor histidine kinase [Methanolobus sp. ZRKC3]|uniref:PAS domain-containing sensor histidine kinase n=1 Tax=Methanolobus sp. ZRKC3 TaxID=3125786 RepID=UPI00324349C2